MCFTLIRIFLGNTWILIIKDDYRSDTRLRVLTQINNGFSREPGNRKYNPHLLDLFLISEPSFYSFTMLLQPHQIILATFFTILGKGSSNSREIFSKKVGGSRFATFLLTILLNTSESSFVFNRVNQMGYQNDLFPSNQLVQEIILKLDYFVVKIVFLSDCNRISFSKSRNFCKNIISGAKKSFNQQIMSQW